MTISLHHTAIMLRCAADTGRLNDLGLTQYGSGRYGKTEVQEAVNKRYTNGGPGKIAPGSHRAKIQKGIMKRHGIKLPKEERQISASVSTEKQNPNGVGGRLTRIEKLLEKLLIEFGVSI